jgi:hypothetical protein
MEAMGSIFKFVFARLREPSTWAGLGTIAVAVGSNGGAALFTQLGTVVPMILGTVAMVVPDKGATPSSASEKN